MAPEEDLLQMAVRYLREQVSPEAQRMDRDRVALAKALQGLADLNLMALKRPEAYGGPGLSEPVFRRFQEEVARVSGSLAFLQTQHQSAVAMIARGENEALKSEYLPKMANGERYVGIGFSQLRRSGPPCLLAIEVDGGYEIHGHVPWVTGWEFYPEFLMGAALPDGSALFAVVPLVEQPKVVVSPPMKLAAMESANTVTVDFDHFFVPSDRVAFIKPAGWIKNNDMINIALQGSFAMGCAQAGLDILARNAEKKKDCTLVEMYERLVDELERCHVRAEELRHQISEETTSERLDLRAWQIDMASRCALAGVASSGGSANSVHHPAQRVYRESLVYTVSAQTPAIMEATLRRLARV